MTNLKSSGDACLADTGRQALHKKVNEAYFVVLVNDLVEGLEEKEALFSVTSLDELHA